MIDTFHTLARLPFPARPLVAPQKNRLMPDIFFGNHNSDLMAKAQAAMDYVRNLKLVSNTYLHVVEGKPDTDDDVKAAGRLNQATFKALLADKPYPSFQSLIDRQT